MHLGSQRFADLGPATRNILRNRTQNRHRLLPTGDDEFLTLLDRREIARQMGFRLVSRDGFHVGRAKPKSGLSQLSLLVRRSTIHVHAERAATKTGIAGFLQHLGDELFRHIDERVFREKGDASEAAVG